MSPPCVTFFPYPDKSFGPRLVGGYHSVAFFWSIACSLALSWCLNPIPGLTLSHLLTMLYTVGFYALDLAVIAFLASSADLTPAGPSVMAVQRSQRRRSPSFVLLRSCTLMYNLYKITEASTLKEIKRRVFEVFKDDLKWQFRGGAFKTVDCKKMNQVKLRA